MTHDELLDKLNTDEIDVTDFAESVIRSMVGRKFKKFEPESWSRQFIKDRNVGLLMYEYIDNNNVHKLHNITWERINGNIIISNKPEFIEKARHICGSLKNAFA